MGWSGPWWHGRQSLWARAEAHEVNSFFSFPSFFFYIVAFHPLSTLIPLELNFAAFTSQLLVLVLEGNVYYCWAGRMLGGRTAIRECEQGGGWRKEMGNVSGNGPEIFGLS